MDEGAPIFFFLMISPILVVAAPFLILIWLLGALKIKLFGPSLAEDTYKKGSW